MSYNAFTMNMADYRIGAVVLASGAVPQTLASHCSHRALLRLNGRYLLEYLLETLRDTTSIVGTALVIPTETHDQLSYLPGISVTSGETFVENMMRGVRALAEYSPSHILFITGDIPLVTPSGLNDFIHESIASGAALTYPIIPREDCEAHFPGAKRTYVRIKEGTFTGGNVILTKANLLDDKEALIQGLFAARKQPIKLAGILGWNTVIRMLTGTLTLPYLESVGTHLLDAPIRAIITHHAAIGFDVDKAVDLAAVERALAKHSESIADNSAPA